MNNELVPLSDIQEKLKQRVQDAMLDLIPPAALDAYIQKAWKALTEDQPVRDCYNRQTSVVPSELQKMIENQMREVLSTQVKTWFEEWKQGDEASKAAKDVLEAVTKVASSSFIESTAFAIAYQAAQSVNSGVGICPSCRRPATKMSTCMCGCWVN